MIILIICQTFVNTTYTVLQRTVYFSTCDRCRRRYVTPGIQKQGFETLSIGTKVSVVSSEAFELYVTIFDQTETLLVIFDIFFLSFQITCVFKITWQTLRLVANMQQYGSVAGQDLIVYTKLQSEEYNTVLTRSPQVSKMLHVIILFYAWSHDSKIGCTYICYVLYVVSWVLNLPFKLGQTLHVQTEVGWKE